MSSKIMRLIYPPSLLREPILTQLIKRSELTINILQAQITLEEGWLEVEFSGSAEEIERAIEWLKVEGIEVTSVD